MLQVPTQGIAQWVERWSFVSMGEDMDFKKEIPLLRFIVYSPTRNLKTHKVQYRT